MRKSKVKLSRREDPVVLRCQVALFCRSTNLILYDCKPSPFTTVRYLENPANTEAAMLELKAYGEGIEERLTDDDMKIYG
jgi:hypothetical protein